MKRSRAIASCCIDLRARRKHRPVLALRHRPGLLIAWIDDDDVDLVGRQADRGIIAIDQTADRHEYESTVAPCRARRFDILGDGRRVVKIDVAVAVCIRCTEQRNIDRRQGVDNVIAVGACKLHCRVRCHGRATTDARIEERPDTRTAAHLALTTSLRLDDVRHLTLRQGVQLQPLGIGQTQH